MSKGNSQLRQLFEAEGYCVLESLLDETACTELLSDVIQNLSTAHRSGIHESDGRIHAPIPPTTSVEFAVRQCVSVAYDALEGFIGHEQLLVELSSILVFPGARAQPIHADENDLSRRIVSMFVNLVPTERDVGALAVIPGSHEGARQNEAPRVLELPAGSVVVMNGKLQHYGTRNRSVDRFRPVFYCSFGDDDIAGPTYSILPELRGRYRLSDFRLSELSEAAIPELRPERWAAIRVSSRDFISTMYLMNRTEVTGAILITSANRWMVDLIQTLEQQAGKHSVASLGTILGVPLDEMTATLRKLSTLGFVRW